MFFRMRFVGKAVLALAFIAALGWVVMALWNAVIPAAFAGARVIDYAHALGLLVLSRILFGGLRGHGGWHGRRHWRRWEQMTPKEREKFQQGRFAGRCKPRAAAE
jgi:hypothetical protein